MSGEPKRVPESVAEILSAAFAKAQQYVRTYFRDRADNPDQGTIHISDERYILVRAASMSTEFFDLVKSLYEEVGEEKARRVASGILFDVAHAIGKADARAFHQKMGVTEPVDKLSIGPLHFAFSGWATVDLLPGCNPVPDESYFLHYDHPNSFEAESWLKIGKKTTFPVCVMNSGYSSGWCEESFGLPLSAVEYRCRAAGDEHCRFVMSHPDRIMAHLRRLGVDTGAEGGESRAVFVPEFFKRKRTVEELARAVDERTAELRRANEQLLRELTERERVEEALRASEERYHRLFEDSRDAIYINTRDGNFVDVNKSALELFGYTREEMMGMNARDLYARSEERRRFQREIERHGSVRDFEIQLRRSDGSLMDCLITSTVRRDAAGGIVGYQGIIHDITKRKRAEEAVRESEEKFRAISGTAADAIIMLDHSGGISYWNPAAERMFGYDSGEAIGRELHLFLAPPKYHEQYRKGFAAFTGTGNGPAVGKTLEFTARRKDGTEFPIEVSTSALKIKGDWHAVGIVRDVSERRRVESESKRMQAQLLQAQKMEAIGTLAGGVAHDFNNLLTAIRGYADLAILKSSESDASHWYLKQINQVCLRAADLTRQMLLFSRKEPVELIPLNINSVIEELLNMLDRLIGEDITVQARLEPDLWNTFADQGTMGQVVMNLAVNARDAMPQGGTLSISTENVVLDEEYCRYTPEARPGKAVCLSIADTGVGMKEGVLEHIFEPFFSTKETGKGTGLGLAVAFGIVHQHDGWITVSSRPGEGSVFKVYLPATSAKLREAQPETVSLESYRGEGERLLLVEDEADVRALTADALRDNGYEILSAGSVEEALAIFDREEGRFDLVFSDVVLPDQTGVRLIEDLHARRPELKVLLCSGYADQKSQWATIRERGYRFLKKPYSLAELSKTIKEMLQAGRQPASPSSGPATSDEPSAES